MGEIADAMLEGMFCQHCGEVIGDGLAPGHPRPCYACMTPEQRRDVQHQRLGQLQRELEGEPDADYVDRDEQRQHSKDKRASNREQSSHLLTVRGIRFESKNAGAHLIVREGARVIDFWPGTGKYMERGQRDAAPAPASGRGVFNLLKELKRKQGSKP